MEIQDSKRHRSSIEHAIMERRLQEWRAKKGLPILGKFQEEQENMKLAYSTPQAGSKRKLSKVTQSERRVESSASQLKQARFHTPDPSCKIHAARCSNTKASSVSLTDKQAGRRSLAPVNAPKQQARVSSADDRQIDAGGAVVPLTARVSRQQPTSQAPKSSKRASHIPHHTQRRKSVRFISPTAKTPAPVTASSHLERVNASTPSCVTPASNKAKMGMRERLEQWLVAKGKTPSRFHNFLGYESSLAHTRPSSTHGGGFKGRRRSGTPHHPPAPGWGRASLGQAGNSTVHNTMKECLEMLEEGCPVEDMSSWLDGLVTKIPLLQQDAGYWTCRAKIAEKRDGDQSAIECLFEAAEFHAEPAQEILDALAVYRLKLRLTHDQQPEKNPADTYPGGTTPVEAHAQSLLRRSPRLLEHTPVARLQFEPEDGEATHQSPERETGEGAPCDTSHLSIKYSLKETTPYFARIHKVIGTSPSNTASTSCLMVTPVRRSARLDNKRRSVLGVSGGTPLPMGLLAAHREEEGVVVGMGELCLDSMEDVAAAHPNAQLILRTNRALGVEFSEAGLAD